MLSTTCREEVSLKVLMVTPGFHPIKGGTETVVRNLSVELNKIGVHTDVMTFNMDRKWNPKWRGKIENIEGITVFKIPALNWLPTEHSSKITLEINLLPGRFRNILRKYEIIHFHEDDLSFPLFSFFVRKHKIFQLHGLDVNYYKRYHLSRFILKNVADLYISISRRIEKDLMELGIPRGKITYLPNGVDTKLFSPKGEKEDNLLLFVGRLTSTKGLHVLLESLPYLRKSVHLVIVGPADWSLTYNQGILKWIEKENKEGRHKIQYLGALDHSDIIKWYQKAAIVILPSFLEGFPVVILEALSCETPVIATPAGGIPEVVQNYKNGVLVPPNDPLKLGEAIQYLIENKDVRIKMGREGREGVIREFSLEIIAKRLQSVYQSLPNINRNG